MFIFLGKIEDPFFAMDRIPVQFDQFGEMTGKHSAAESFRIQILLRPESFHNLLAFPPLPEKHQIGRAESPQLHQSKNHRSKQQHNIRKHETCGHPIQNLGNITHFLFFSL